jgi:dihydrofolate reductase
MGRKSFETVLAFDPWPYGEKRVIVLSTTLDAIPTPVGGRVELFKGDQEALLEKLAVEGVRRVYLDGGKTIQRFLRAGLVSDILITRIPILIGDGIPLFGPLDGDVALTHLRTEAYPNGFVQSVYAVGEGTDC